MRRLLLVGGGHAHVEVIREFGERQAADVSMTLVSPDRFTPYSGMWPGWIAGHYSLRDCHIDLETLTRAAGVRFVVGRVGGLDLEKRRAQVVGGAAIEFDHASLDVGSTPPTDAIEGAAEHALAVKPTDRFVERLPQIEACIEAGTVRSIATIGGGAGGVETLLALRHRLLRERAGRSVAFALVTDEPAPLARLGARVRAIFTRLLEERAIAVHTGFRVRRIEAGAMHAADGRSLDADLAVLATGAAAPAWPRSSGLDCDPRGFVCVDRFLRSTSHPAVFAAGDIASFVERALPKSGVFAVRQGPVLARNLLAAARGAPLTPFVPQTRTLALISTGERGAVATRGELALGAAPLRPLLWRWKDRIDRRFMARYHRSLVSDTE